MSTRTILLILFASLWGWFLFRVVKNRGFKGAAFGAPIKATLGQVAIESGPLQRTRVEVCTLEQPPASDRPGIGVLISRSGQKASVAALTSAQARQLVDMLQAALDQTDKDPGESA